MSEPDLLWKEFNESCSSTAGIHILRLRNSSGALAIANLVGDNAEDSALCVFKSAPDAEEYLYNWIKRPEEWEVLGHVDLKKSIDIVRDNAAPYSFVTLNPPLRLKKSYVIVEVATFIQSMEDSLNDCPNKGWKLPAEWNVPEGFDDDDWDWEGWGDDPWDEVVGI